MKKLLVSLLALGFVYVSTFTPVSSVLAETVSGHGTPSGNRPTPSGNNPTPTPEVVPTPTPEVVPTPTPEVVPTPSGNNPTPVPEDPIAMACQANLTGGMGFCDQGGAAAYWFENGQRQGRYGDPKNIIDAQYGLERGREIYDPVSNAWYWLDAVKDGAKATGKEVWMPYVYQEENGWDDAAKAANAAASGDMAQFVLDSINNKQGKWVRYDGNGKMLKGWITIDDASGLAAVYPEQRGNVYFYDQMTGAMAKGSITLDGTQYHFDEISGKLD